MNHFFINKKNVTEGWKCCCLILLFVGAAVLLQRDVSAQATPPKLELLESHHSFGTVVEGEKIHHQFSLRNVGGSPLIITKILPGCGCITTENSGFTVPPLESHAVPVDFDTTGFANDETRVIQLKTNDPENQIIPLTLSGRITPLVAVTPSRAYFPSIVFGDQKTHTQDFEVHFSQAGKTEDIVVHALSRFLKVEVLTRDSNTIRFRVFVLPSARSGELREKIILSSPKDKAFSKVIPVFASIKKVLEVDPDGISFGVLQGNELVVRRVTLKNLLSSPITIQSVDSSNEILKTSLKTLEAGKVFELSLSLDPKKVSSSVKATVSILTDVPDAEPIVIRVHAVSPAHRS